MIQYRILHVEYLNLCNERVDHRLDWPKEAVLLREVKL